MLDVRYVRESDRNFWFSLDKHLQEDEFFRKIDNHMGYVLTSDDVPLGLLRYFLFWDSIPFCSLLYIREDMRGKGGGRALIDHWETDMAKRGYDLAMTSTQADETAQHFYRKLGYNDCGSLLLPFPGYEQPTELIMIKDLRMS